MSKNLVIRFDEEATEKYLKLAEARMIAEVEANCEPCGVSIKIEVGPDSYGSYAYLGDNSIGEVSVELLEETPILPRKAWMVDASCVPPPNT